MENSGVIKGVNSITCWFTPLFAEREGNGLLCKIIKELYQIISKIIEQQKVTDMIWYDVLFLDSNSSNTFWKSEGQKVGQLWGKIKGGQKKQLKTVLHQQSVFILQIGNIGAKSGVKLYIWLTLK